MSSSCATPAYGSLWSRRAESPWTRLNPSFKSKGTVRSSPGGAGVVAPCVAPPLETYGCQLLDPIAKSQSV